MRQYFEQLHARQYAQRMTVRIPTAVRVAGKARDKHVHGKYFEYVLSARLMMDMEAQRILRNDQRIAAQIGLHTICELPYNFLKYAAFGDVSFFSRVSR